jgi:hypothetical protein
MRVNRSIILLIFFIVTASIELSFAVEISGKWQTRAPTPVPRSEVAAVELSGKIYLMGRLR